MHGKFPGEALSISAMSWARNRIRQRQFRGRAVDDEQTWILGIGNLSFFHQWLCPNRAPGNFTQHPGYLPTYP